MAERRSTDKIHIDKTIQIYQIVTLLIVVISAIVYQSDKDATQDIGIAENKGSISANKEADLHFQKEVLEYLAQINKRGDRQEKESHEYIKLILDYLKGNEAKK